MPDDDENTSVSSSSAEDSEKAMEDAPHPDDEGDNAVKDEARSSLSKSWSISSSHVPTYTGGKVIHSKKPDHPFLLLPVHGDLALVDATKGTKVGTLRGDAALFDEDDAGVDNDAITAFALDGKDETIITCSRNNLLRHYSVSLPDLKTNLLKTWGRSGHTLPVRNMQFHPSSVFLATASVDGSVRVWDARGGFATHVFRPVAGGDGGGSGRLSVTAIRWRNEVGKLVIAIARDDGSIAIHDLRDKDHIIVLRDHVSAVTCLDWWGDDYFVSAGRDAILNLWRIVSENNQENKRKKKKSLGAKLPRESYRRIQSLPVYEQVEGMAIVTSREEGCIRIATAGSKGVVRLWGAKLVAGKTPELAKLLEQSDSQAFGELRGGYTGLVPIHECDSDLVEQANFIAVDAEHNLSFLTAKLLTRRTIIGHNDEILDLKIIPGTGSMIVATNSTQIRIFHRENFSCDVLDGHKATVLCVATSPCGRLVASCGKDKTMRIWNVVTRKCVGIAIGHTEPIGACALSQQPGRYEVTGKAAKNGGGAFCVTGSVDRTLKRWNLNADADMLRTSEPADLVAASGIRAHDKDINVISIAPNDSLVATGSQDKTVKLWIASDLTLKATIKGHRRGVWDCQFSPVDRVLATSSGDKSIKLWSLTDYSCLRTFQGHLASVLRVRFLKTGLQLMSAGADSLIKLWTIRTNECETTLDGHTDKIWALDMDSDGRTIVSGGADSKLNVWEDYTKREEESTRAKEAELILLEQSLANHLRHKEYEQALAIALQIQKPFQALKVLTAIVEQDLKQMKAGIESLQMYAKTWSMERVAQILKYCRDWNTRARNAPIAMLVVKAIVTTISVDRLLIADIPEILAGITPYAERHFERLDQLHTSTYLVDYTLSAMGHVEPLLEETSPDERFVRWEASSKLVLPPKYIDGRIQIGGKAVVGRAELVPSDKLDEVDEIMSIGESSSDSSSAEDDSTSSFGSV